MPTRIFSLANGEFQVPAAGGLEFGWAALEPEIRSQIAFQEQFLRFLRHLYQNLQSVPIENPHWNPTPLSLSLKAGALKTYILAAVSIIEGALAELATIRGLGEREALHRKAFGSLLRSVEGNAALRAEFDPIWNHLVLLKRYRNFVHLGNAASAAEAYWQDVLNNEAPLLAACDTTIQWLSEKCDAL
jgi:hypothetical protein